VRLISPGTPATTGCTVPTPVENDDYGCGAVGEIKTGRGKPAPVPLRPPLHDMTWDRA
jgi:hypothetical protein